MTPALPLPRGWPAHARRALLHAIALARVVLSAAATSVRTRRWVSAVQTAAVAQEEARLLRARLEHVPAAHRPHYPATARLAILELRTAMGWTLAETARRFLITPETVSSWMRRLDEEGPRALVRAREPSTDTQTSCASSCARCARLCQCWAKCVSLRCWRDLDCI